MSLSRESVELFKVLLSQVQISAQADNLEEQARKITQAKREIDLELVEDGD